MFNPQYRNIILDYRKLTVIADGFTFNSTWYWRSFQNCSWKKKIVNIDYYCDTVFTLYVGSFEFMKNWFEFNEKLIRIHCKSNSISGVF